MTPPSPSQTTAPMALLIREALDAVAAPVMREAILREALRRERRREVPERLDRLRPFVEGPLRSAICDALGVPVADQVMEQLERLFHALSIEEEVSEVRPAASVIPRAPRAPMDLAPTRKHALPVVDGSDEISHAQGTMPAPEMVPVVLLASRDRETLHELRDGLTGGLDVVSVDDPIALLDALQATSCLAVIVVDARHPSVQPATMAAMAPDLPPGVQVVLWGVTPRMEAEINALGDGTLHWVGVDAGTPPEEVAFLCLTMLRDVG